MWSPGVIRLSPLTVAADAAQKPGISPADFSIVNQPGAASYPISGYSWALIYIRQHNQATGQALVTMLDWLTHNGQASAASNGYVPLPSQIQQLAGPCSSRSPAPPERTSPASPETAVLCGVCHHPPRGAGPARNDERRGGDHGDGQDHERR
jgi:hypothetical protein